MSIISYHIRSNNNLKALTVQVPLTLNRYHNHSKKHSQQNKSTLYLKKNNTNND